jgi:hypothetical protein
MPKKGRDVATAHIPGAFMQTEMKGTIQIVLECTMAKLLVKIDPKLYQKHLLMQNRKPVMHVQLKKALYGTLQAGLLFWKDMTKSLKEWGFKINPYDWCVGNKMIDGEQCTVIWHVDNIRISHEDPKVVTAILALLEERYGRKAPLTITCGKEHDYLGMTLDYSKPGKVEILMNDYIKGIAGTPLANHLFQVKDNAERLDKETVQLFHPNLAKLLFLCKLAPPNVQTTVTFLTTRVQEPDIDD